MLRHYDLAKAKLLNCPSPQAPSPCDASTAPTNGHESAGACSASSNTTKYGSDGTIYCINGGTISGTVGSCECTCKSGYTGSSCETASSPSQKAMETKEKVEKTRDAMLTGVTDAKLKKKTKLLADAAISGKKVRKMSAKLSAADADAACSDYYTKAGLSSSLGACIATVASRRRSLVATTYDVSVFFSEAEVDDATLTAAENSLKAEGVTVSRRATPSTRSPNSGRSTAWTRAPLTRSKPRRLPQRRQCHLLHRHPPSPRLRPDRLCLTSLRMTTTTPQLL